MAVGAAQLHSVEGRNEREQAVAPRELNERVSKIGSLFSLMVWLACE